MVSVASAFFQLHRLIIRRDVEKDSTAKTASDDKTKSKERDCRVKFPHLNLQRSASSKPSFPLL